MDKMGQSGVSSLGVLGKPYIGGIFSSSPHKYGLEFGHALYV